MPQFLKKYMDKCDCKCSCHYRSKGERDSCCEELQEVECDGTVEVGESACSYCKDFC